MRITILSCVVLALMTTTSAAQMTYVGPWQPRPTIGIGLGAFGAIAPNSDARLIRSGTVEIPLSDKARIRFEAGRSTLPIVPEGATDSSAPTDTARIERLTISLAGLKKPGAPVTSYLGAGVEFRRATFERSPKPLVRAGLHLHGGAELLLSDGLTLDAELGLHGFRNDPWHQRKLVTGEAVIRIKVGL